MFTTKLLKFNIVALLFLTRLLGFWPYFYNKSTRSYVTTWYLLLYPVVAMSGFFGAIIYSAMTIYADQKEQFHSYAANLTQYSLLIFSFMVFFSGYIIQYFKFNYLQDLLSRVQKYVLKIRSINNQQLDSNYTDLTIRFIIKFVIVISITVFCDYSQLEYYTKMGTNNVSIIKACTTLPAFIFCIIPNVFYAGILLACYFYRQLNNLITEVVKSSIPIGGAKKHHMTRFCELSDRLDEISILHMELSCITKSWNILFSIPIFFWICYKFAFVIASMFFNYVVLRDWLISNDDHRLENRVGNTFYSGLELLMVALELFLVTNGCFNVAFEVMSNFIYYNHRKIVMET